MAEKELVQADMASNQLDVKKVVMKKTMLASICD
jgi:hypothetical protein